MATRNKASSFDESSLAIVIPEIAQGQMTVTIRGITPLLCHRAPIEEMENDGRARPKKVIYDPEEECRKALYTRPGSAKCYFPGGAIKNAMVSAVSRFVNIKKGPTFKGLFFVRDEYLVIDSPITEECPEGWTVRKDIVRVQNAAVVRCRPMFFPWSISVPIHFIAQWTSPSQIINALKIAGTSIGIGDFRIEKDGTFGQFEVDTTATDIRIEKIA